MHFYSAVRLGQTRHHFMMIIILPLVHHRL